MEKRKSVVAGKGGRSAGNVVDVHPANRVANQRRRLARVRAKAFPHATCPASRHVALMAEILSRGQPYPMLTEEPEHCAESLLSVVESLWKARLQLIRLKK